MLAIIPARGGSKRLPRKNIADFHGKPLIAWTIEAAQKSNCFSEIVVSTDDEEIAAVAAKCWAKVERRPADLATDESRVVDVCLSMLSARNCTQFACLYATSPLRTGADISGVVGLLKPFRCDFAMAVAPFECSPHQALKEDDGYLSPMWPELIEKRHNEIPRLYVDNGSTYAATVEAFRQHKTFYGPNLRGWVMPRERSVDIDTQLDLDYARFLGAER
jgi:pseudaminic acid cytidylyltransferase